MKRMIAVLLAATLVLVACGSDPEVAGVPTTTPGGGEISDPLPLADGDADGTMLAGMGPGISVADLLTTTLEGPLLVNGYVFVGADGSVVLADAIAESFPPQPAGSQITVQGVDLMQLPLTEGPTETEIAITAWTEIPVQLIGELNEGVFVGNSVASA